MADTEMNQADLALSEPLPDQVQALFPPDQTRVFFQTEVGAPLIFAVIAARYEDTWAFVLHKDRSTFEMPAGHIEPGETPFEAAKRELFEETGALEFTLDLIGPYGVIIEGMPTTYGMLYLAQITRLGELPPFEMEERVFCKSIPENLTYPDIQPILIEKASFWLMIVS